MLPAAEIGGAKQMAFVRMSLAATSAFAAVAIITTAASATDYWFDVSCSNRALVVEWGVGDIDPGREYLRFTTGTKYPNCSVSDYDANADFNKDHERYSHESAIINGVPLVGPIICGIFDC